MIEDRLSNIQEVIKTFKDDTGEPKGSCEQYMLKALWVMLCAEFEGCFKGMIETYIDNANSLNEIKKVHPLLILKGRSGKKFSYNDICKIFKGGGCEINFQDVIGKDNTTYYKSKNIIELLNSIGIFFKENEIADIKLLDGIAQTRDAIAHGYLGIDITKAELDDNIKQITKTYNLIKSKCILN